jgi:hypothetical protein
MKFWLNACACVISAILIVLLFLNLPEAVLRDSEAYRMELLQRIDSEQSITVLKQLSVFKINYLIASNQTKVPRSVVASHSGSSSKIGARHKTVFLL